MTFALVYIQMSDIDIYAYQHQLYKLLLTIKFFSSYELDNFKKFILLLLTDSATPDKFNQFLNNKVSEIIHDHGPKYRQKKVDDSKFYWKRGANRILYKDANIFATHIVNTYDEPTIKMYLGFDGTAPYYFLGTI